MLKNIWQTKVWTEAVMQYGCTKAASVDSNCENYNQKNRSSRGSWNKTVGSNRRTYNQEVASNRWTYNDSWFEPRNL